MGHHPCKRGPGQLDGAAGAGNVICVRWERTVCLARELLPRVGWGVVVGEVGKVGVLLLDVQHHAVPKTLPSPV